MIGIRWSTRERPVTQAAAEAAALSAKVVAIDNATEENRQLELAIAMSRYTNVVALTAKKADTLAAAAKDADGAGAKAWAKACTAVEDAICVSHYTQKNAKNAHGSMKVCECTVDTVHAEIIAAFVEYDALPMGTDDSVLDVAILKYEDLCNEHETALKKFDNATSAFNQAADDYRGAILKLHAAIADETALRT